MPSEYKTKYNTTQGTHTAKYILKTINLLHQLISWLKRITGSFFTKYNTQKKLILSTRHQIHYLTKHFDTPEIGQKFYTSRL